MNEAIQGAGKSKLRRYLVTALVLALAITGGLFAYTYTSQTTTLGAVSISSDFANVTVNNTVPNYAVLGSYRGKIPQGNLFEVSPSANYSGDLQVNVYLSNVDQLSYKYGMLLMRVRIVNGANATVDVENMAKPLTLNNGQVSFTCDGLTPLSTYHVQMTGGVYRTFPWAYLTSSGGSYTPSITCEVLQAGL
jgi:hypothetical protein